MRHPALVRRLLVALLLAGTAGCVTIYDKSEMVMRRASFDLACTDGRLSVREIGANAFGAEGCGRRASYVVLCTGVTASSCTPLLDSGRDGSAAALSIIETH